MNTPIPLKSLLLGFLPLLIFVAADEFLSQLFSEEIATQYALYLAIAMGVIQTLYTFIKEKRLDKMLLCDTFLIIVMGGISLVSGNDMFFKLKPALVQSVMVALLFYVAFFKPQLLLSMTNRFMQGVEIQAAQLRAMQRSAQGLALLFLLHTLLIIYAALFLSKPAWAFISGPLLYIFAGLYFACLWTYGRWKRRNIPPTSSR
ncbi:MAG: septation protein IspZ [Proteobacteria bacterium]|nr:septation protein IspZ [Pseudomonadota bacterium]